MIGKCPMPLNGCSVAEKEGACYSDTHHIYWEKDWYATKEEKDFSELFTVQICRRVHNELHAITKPPEKPTARYIRDTIQKHR